MAERKPRAGYTLNGHRNTGKTQTSTLHIAPRLLKEAAAVLNRAKAAYKRTGKLTEPKDALLPLQEKVCPNCGKTKPALDGFGVKKVKLTRGREVTKVHSWCRACRNDRALRPENRSDGQESRAN